MLECGHAGKAPGSWGGEGMPASVVFGVFSPPLVRFFFCGTVEDMTGCSSGLAASGTARGLRMHREEGPQGRGC